MHLRVTHTASRKNPPAECLAADPGAELVDKALETTRLLNLAIEALTEIAPSDDWAGRRATNALRAIHREMCG